MASLKHQIKQVLNYCRIKYKNAIDIWCEIERWKLLIILTQGKHFKNWKYFLWLGDWFTVRFHWELRIEWCLKSDLHSIIECTSNFLRTIKSKKSYGSLNEVIFIIKFYLVHADKFHFIEDWNKQVSWNKCSHRNWHKPCDWK